MVNPPLDITGGLVRGLLNSGFEGTAGRVLGVVAGNVLAGIVQQRLAELEVEAARLSEVGARLEMDNPVLRTFLADLGGKLSANGREMAAEASTIQANGATVAGQTARQLALPGLSDAELDIIGIRWNVPDPDAVNALVGYVDSEAWRQQLAQYGDDVLEVVNNQAVLGIVNGRNPVQVAQDIRMMVESFPISQAENLLRTVQLTSYRTADAIHSGANADIITRRIRVAVLDDRTCLSCIALHGSELRPGERVDDHHRGRCTALDEVVGFPRTVTSGSDWFFSLPEERQLIIAGPGKLEVLLSGRATLPDFVHEYTDPVFGRMLREGSLRGLELN